MVMAKLKPAAMSAEEKATKLAAMPPEKRAVALAAMPIGEKAAALAAMDVEEKAEALKDMDDEEKEAVQARVTVDATVDITELLAMDDEEQISALATKDDKERATVLAAMEDKKAELAAMPTEFKLRLDIEVSLAGFESNLAYVVLLGLLVPAVGILAMISCAVSYLSLSIMTKKFGSSIKDRQDVFLHAHLQGLGFSMVPTLLMSCGLRTWFWHDNELSGWEMLAYGQPAALVVAYIQHKVRESLLLKFSCQPTGGLVVSTQGHEPVDEPKREESAAVTITAEISELDDLFDDEFKSVVELRALEQEKMTLEEEEQGSCETARSSCKYLANLT